MDWPIFRVYSKLSVYHGRLKIISWYFVPRARSALQVKLVRERSTLLFSCFEAVVVDLLELTNWMMTISYWIKSCASKSNYV